MRFVRVFLLIGIAAALVFAGCTKAPAEPYKESEVKEVAPVNPTMEDKCPICGMMPARYPEWRAQVVLKSGERYHFDSPKDMFKFVLGLTNNNEPKEWVNPNDIAAIFVTDYNTKEYIDAKKAYYVRGSDVQGPMGEDVVPFASEEDAKAFSSQHGGEVIGYSDITVEFIKTLKMKMGGMNSMQGMEGGEEDMKM